DPRFVMYWEEVDWCKRVHKAGWAVGYLPSARVVHFVEQSARQLSPARRTWLYEDSTIRYADKHFGSAGGSLVSGATALRRLVRALKPNRVPPAPVGDSE